MNTAKLFVQLWLILGGLLCCQINTFAQTIQKRVHALSTAEFLNTDPCQFSGIDDHGNYLFAGTKDTQTIPITELVWWNGPVDSIDHPLVHLVDGSVIAGTPIFLEGDQIELQSRYWRPIQIPLNAIRSIEFQIPREYGQRSQLTRELDEKPDDQTRVWLTNGDQLDGRFVRVTAQREFSLLSNDRHIQIPFARISAISFASHPNAEGRQSPAASFEFSLKDGSRLRVSEVEFLEDQINATCGELDLKFQPKQNATIRKATSLVCGIRNLEFDTDYLTRLRPAKYQHDPLLGRKMMYQFDQSIVRSTFRFGRTIFPFGIGMPSKSSLVFAIDNASDDLQLEFGVAIDPSANQRGDALCRILILDQSNQWTKHTWSARIRGSDPHVFFSRIQLGDCRAIALSVDYSDDADVLDRVNWIMPRLFR